MADELDVEALAREDATKALVQRASGEAPSFMDKWVKPAALPMAGSIAGEVIGAPFAPPWGSIVGGGIGSGVGEAANQALGITEPSLTNIGLATGVPMAVGGAVQAVQPLVKMAGAKGAQLLNALAPDEAVTQLAKLTPKTPSGPLFKIASDAQVKVPMNRTLHALDDLMEEVADVSKGAKEANAISTRYLKGLKDLLTTNPNGLSPATLQRELESIGAVKASLKTKGGGGLGRIDQVFKHMTKDLDDAVEMASWSQPGARALVAARDTWKKESVLKEIGEEIDNATKFMRGQGASEQFNPAAVLNKIKKNEFYEDAFTAAERTEFEGILKLLNRIPALRPGAGQQYGHGVGGKITRFAAGGAGAGYTAGGYVGKAFGVEGLEIPGAVAGAAIGGSAPYMAEFGRNFTTAMSMDTGRALMKELLTQSKGTVTPQVASIIGAYAAAVRAGQVNE
jgi:hypothetical protein